MTSRPIRVALAGVGNCASSLVQAIGGRGGWIGVITETLGGYTPDDIEIVAAFDIDHRKLGRDLSHAIFEAPNVAVQHSAVAELGVVVSPGILLDGADGPLSEVVEVDSSSRDISIEDISRALTAAAADVLVCYLPTGSRAAVQAYAEAACIGKVAFINATAEAVANDSKIRDAFASRNVPLLGDDVRSQLGATALHAALLELCERRGATVDTTYQLNIGGNTDFLNLSDRTRSASKWTSKHKALDAAVAGESPRMFAGPVGYVPFLGDEKVAYLRINGRLLLNMPFSIEIRLQVEDSPNSAGVILEAIRIAKASADHGHGGTIDPVCAFLFKNPVHGATETEAWAAYRAFVAALD